MLRSIQNFPFNPTVLINKNSLEAISLIVIISFPSLILTRENKNRKSFGISGEDYPKIHPRSRHQNNTKITFLALNKQNKT
jgi:hypothetical protein